MMENKKGNEKSTSMLIAFMVFNTHFYIFRKHFRWIGLCIKVFAHTHKKQQSSSKLFPTRKKQQTEERMNQNKMQAEKKRTATIQRRVASGSFIRICASCVFIASTSQWYQLSSHYNVRMHKKMCVWCSVQFGFVWFVVVVEVGTTIANKSTSTAHTQIRMITSIRSTKWILQYNNAFVFHALRLQRWMQRSKKPFANSSSSSSIYFLTFIRLALCSFLSNRQQV